MTDPRPSAAQQQPNPSLGSDYKTHVHSDQQSAVPKPPDPAKYADESPTEYRFRLLGLAQRVQGIHDDRLSRCHQQLAPQTATVEVRCNPEQTTAHFRGLFVCNRGWTCPACAQRISNERREELTAAFLAAKKLGFGVCLVTYTVQHNSRQSLGGLWDALQAALGAFKSGRGWQDIKAEYDVLGTIRALETLYGENGWHPHVHELIFTKKALNPAGVAGLKSWLSDRWLVKLKVAGLDASIERGIDVRTADSDIADYIAKWGHEPKEQAWGADHEMAKLASKKSHSKGVTPFGLLEAYGEGDKRAAALFQEYAIAMQGRLRLRWSTGLRELLTLPPELADEQLELPETSETYTAVEFTALEWKKVCAYEVHALVLQLVSVGAIPALKQALGRRGIHAVYHDPPMREAAVVLLPGEQVLPAARNTYEQMTLLDAPAAKQKFEYK